MPHTCTSAAGQHGPRRPSTTQLLLLACCTASPAGLVAQTVFEANRSGMLSERAPAAERVVKGAPYCAEAVHENLQWLADGQGGMGNRISHKTSTLLCRDGEGRTRQEVTSGDRKLVFLHDPGTRENWVLDADKKAARQVAASTWAFSSTAAPTGLDGGVMTLPPGPGGSDSTAWRDYTERMREWARGVAQRARVAAGVVAPTATPAAAAPAVPPTAPTPPTPPTPPMPPSVTLMVPPLPAIIEMPWPLGAASAVNSELRVFRLGQGLGNVPPEVTWRAQQFAPRGAGEQSSLGSKDLEGLKVHGERTTWTIEAGKLGNEKPIVITRDVWTSPDLMLTVQSRDFDPRSGEQSYRLLNVKRGEPDAALMKVPADYSVTRRGERPARSAAPTAGPALPASPGPAPAAKPDKT